METFSIRYNPSNILVTKMLEALMHIKGVERVYPDDELSPEELQQAELSLNSEICTDITKLEKLLESKL